jgi:DNA-binding NarL/FixJ family response regulator
VDVIRILVADRTPHAREALASGLNAVDGFCVVGKAATESDLLEQGRQLSPDVALLDLDLAGKGGSDAIPRMLSQCPGLSIVVLSLYPDDDRVAAAILGGARAHLAKGSRLAEIARTVRSVHEGGAASRPPAAGI